VMGSSAPHHFFQIRGKIIICLLIGNNQEYEQLNQKMSAKLEALQAKLVEKEAENARLQQNLTKQSTNDPNEGQKPLLEKISALEQQLRESRRKESDLKTKLDEALSSSNPKAEAAPIIPVKLREELIKMAKANGLQNVLPNGQDLSESDCIKIVQSAGKSMQQSARKEKESSAPSVRASSAPAGDAELLQRIANLEDELRKALGGKACYTILRYALLCYAMPYCMQHDLTVDI
jgi:hypothetical protein